MVSAVKNDSGEVLPFPCVLWVVALEQERGSVAPHLTVVWLVGGGGGGGWGGVPADHRKGALNAPDRA